MKKTSSTESRLPAAATFSSLPWWLPLVRGNCGRCMVPTSNAVVVVIPMLPLVCSCTFSGCVHLHFQSTQQQHRMRPDRGGTIFTPSCNSITKQVLLRGMSPTTSSSSSSGSSPEGGEGLLEGSSGKNEAEQKSLMQQQRQAEVLSLRERGAELEERLQAARTALTSARERREFMEEEAEQVQFLLSLAYSHPFLAVSSSHCCCSKRLISPRRAVRHLQCARLLPSLHGAVPSIYTLPLPAHLHTADEKLSPQARDYGNKLAQEMARLGRITRTLPPDEGASLEKLRRLVATLTEIERQEQAALEQGKAREAALRAEIAEFTGETAGDGGGGGGGPGEKAVAVVSPPPDAAPATAGGPAGEGGGGAGKGRVLEKAVDDPLAAMAEPQGQEKEDKSGAGKIVGAVPAAGGGALSVPRTAVVLGGGENGGGGGGGPAERKANHRKKPALEGKALFAEGLHRIEAAYEMAAAEREESASRLSRLRLAVARRQREEDAALGHAELLQYLLRFEELGQHSLERQEQLRRCRAERSTLSLTRELLAKQARLLETIAGGVEEASKGGKGVREAYLRQIKGIVEASGDVGW